MKIKIVDKPSEAPNYTSEVTALKLDHCIIVGHGTTTGNPTVDLVFTDNKGNQYIAMTTGAIVEGMGGACAGKRMRDGG